MGLDRFLHDPAALAHRGQAACTLGHPDSAIHHPGLYILADRYAAVGSANGSAFVTIFLVTALFGSRMVRMGLSSNCLHGVLVSTDRPFL